MSRARQSMYPAPPSSSHWTALEQCSYALQASCANVQEAVQVLHEATVDLPRLASIVQSRRMFDLVTEPDVFSAQRALANEMSPQIEELIGRAEDGLEGLKQRERALRTKVDKRATASSRATTPVTVAQDELDALEQKLAQLQQRKERLGREVELLEDKVEGAGRRKTGAYTARALSLVNKRIGAIVQREIVEVVHLRWKNDEDQPTFACSTEMHRKTRSLFVNIPWDRERALSPTFLPPFHALCDLRLVYVRGVHLEWISQLPELRNLLLFRGAYCACAPLVAHKLAHLTLSFCTADVAFAEPSRLLDSSGCPSLRSLYLGRWNPDVLALCTTDLLEQLDNIGMELFDEKGPMGSWTWMNLDGALLDKALVDCAWQNVDLLEDNTKGPRYFRIYDTDVGSRSHYLANCCRDLANRLHDIFPDLRSLHLPRILNVPCSNHPTILSGAARHLTTTCSDADVEVVFEDCDILHEGETHEHKAR
ncbi:hypothetical protein JCM3770_000130 [Rhodotorula araucariae]